MPINYFKFISLLRLLGFLLLTISFSGLAQAMTPYNQTTEEAVWHVSSSKPLVSWYMDLGLGWVFNQRLATGYLNNFDLPPDRYNAPQVQQSSLVSLSGGYVWQRLSQWLPFTSLGLEYSYFFPAQAEGIIEDYSDEEEANHSYQYKVAHQIVYLRGKIDLVRWQNWMPYVSAGLGSSWNRFSNYSEQAITNVDSFHEDPKFPNKTTTHFSYSLGIGIDYIFTRNLWGSLGYRFDHIGPFQTGTSEVFVFAQESVNTSMKAHSLVGSLRYLFG